MGSGELGSSSHSESERLFLSIMDALRDTLNENRDKLGKEDQEEITLVLAFLTAFKYRVLSMMGW